MMSEIDLFQWQEDSGYGDFLQETICDIYGIKPIGDWKGLLNKYIFKFTSCGAWIKFDSEGIMVGTIVEGSDAEFSTRISLENVDTDDAGAKLLKQRFFEALQECEDFATEHFGDEE